MKQVIRQPIFDGNLNSNKSWAIEQAQINGNKKVRIVLEASISETAQNENVLLDMTSQVDENNNNVTLFNYDVNTQLLTPTEGIPNVVGIEFDHLITYTGSNQSGGNNNANDVVELVQRIVDNASAIPIETQREVDKMSSALNLPSGQSIEVPKKLIPQPLANPEAYLAIDSLISIGWTLKSYNSPVVTCSNLRIVLDINYYKQDEQGGN